MVIKPYKEVKLGKNKYKRLFSKDVNSDELTWHRDLQNRIIYTKDKTDWQFQFNNNPPIDIEQNKKISIPKNTYHRLIKGKEDLSLIVMIENNISKDIKNLILEYEEKINPSLN
jgi:hypothetical protein